MQRSEKSTRNENLWTAKLNGFIERQKSCFTLLPYCCVTVQKNVRFQPGLVSEVPPILDHSKIEYRTFLRSVKETAYRLGFAELTHSTIYHRKYTGQSPVGLRVHLPLVL